MSTRPWMPLYVGNYLADTTHLTTQQHGAYFLLICSYWQRGFLPDDDEQLARICGLSLPEWKRHRPVLRQFFKEGWSHTRVDRELASALEKYERRANAGKRGNQVRWGDRNAIALGSQSQSQSQSQQKELSQGEESLSEGTSEKKGTSLSEGTSSRARPRLAAVGDAALARGGGR